MKLYAGFDGGGSKTACYLADEQGNLLGVGLGGASNYLFCGKESAAKAMRDALAAAFAQAGRTPCTLAGAFIGSAAILLGNGAFHASFFRSCVPAEMLECDSDLVPIWYGGAQGADAVVAIAGTGSIAYGFTQEQYFRVGGWGPLLGDEGSGYDLGQRALRLAARMADGRVEAEPAFLQGILSFYGVQTPHDLISCVKGEDYRQKIASCAKAVFDLAQQGSPTGTALLEETADELALLCRTAAKKAGNQELPVILSGGLAEPMLPYLKKRLKSLTTLQMHPGLACAALALEKAGLSDSACRLLKEGTRC